MKITDKISITKNDNGFMLNGVLNPDVTQEELETIYRACRRKNDDEKISIFNRMIDEGHLPYFSNTCSADEIFNSSELIKSCMNDMINFFSEFQFLPNFRFINSLAHAVQANNHEAYITNYFRLIDSPYSAEIQSKIKSAEFKMIMETMRKVKPTKTVNKRLKIYFGPQGTGKTTAALKETNNLSMVCNASLLPSDLMEDFTFDDGKAAFHPSILARCMEEGRMIVLDEINLLPFDSLRFLQGITDDKNEINYKGHTIHISEGFKIIGTMNLTVNGVTFGLPEPLADRCETIDEYTLTAEQLIGAIL